MRPLLLVFLLTSAAAPALAEGGDDLGGRRQRSEAIEQPDGRTQRASESQRSQAGERRAVAAHRSERGQARQGGMGHIREYYRQQHQGRDLPDTTRSAVGEAPSSLRPRERHIRTIPDSQPATTTTRRSTTHHGGFQSGTHRDHYDGRYTRWSHDWRHDRRYDWYHHRNRHRSLFRIGFYYDPFGWNYRRWSVGSHIWPSYYRSRFWLNDPWQYRLPPAYGPYRWVRYWDDALLVNIYTGEVVDVIHNFFW